MADRWERTLPCQDAHGRRRDVLIFLDEENQVGIFTPPGDTAKLPTGHVRNLQALLSAAVAEATKRGGER